MSGDGQLMRVRAAGGEQTELLAPGVGVFTPAVAEGELVSAGQSIGTLDVLGVQQSLIVPDGIAGRVARRAGAGRSRVPVQYGDALLVVSAASIADASAAGAAATTDSSDALSFVAPMSGRFYSRPSPNEPAFVSDGDTVQQGQTIGLLEVMKTFNRLVYQGDALPTEAKVEKVVPSDGDDVVRGDPILMLASREA